MRRGTSKTFATYWTIVNAVIILGVWQRTFPWWMVAALVTLDCVISACDKWTRALDA